MGNAYVLSIELCVFFLQIALTLRSHQAWNLGGGKENFYLMNTEITFSGHFNISGKI